MLECGGVRLVAGHGVAGDRYANGVGYYSHRPNEGRQVTLIEIETLEAVAHDHGIELTPAETRRNLVTRGVRLNLLVGHRFRVGEAVLYGDRLNVPCKYLERLVGKPVFKPLIDRSGLNCQILAGGWVRPGDAVRPY
ncbi:MAG: MOSC domain-containing protein [Pseudonocardiaceae bacterium]|nr:MOSC domain-containing protein [Pseudonocardiaceae bacterium]